MLPRHAGDPGRARSPPLRRRDRPRAGAPPSRPAPDARAPSDRARRQPTRLRAAREARAEGARAGGHGPGRARAGRRALQEPPDAARASTTRFLQAGIGRDGLVVAFGGGVVGDVAGYAAATYMRGVDWVGIPTTLLSMVDSSVGGKVGINHPDAKNLIGAFHQPRAVVIDPSFLATLAPRELRSGAYEILKCAILGDGALFAALRSRSFGAARLGAGRARERDRHGLPDQGRRRREGRARGRAAARAQPGPHDRPRARGRHGLPALHPRRGRRLGSRRGRLDRAPPRDARRGGVGRDRLRGRPHRPAPPRVGSRSRSTSWPRSRATRRPGPAACRSCSRPRSEPSRSATTWSAARSRARCG